MSKFSCLRAMVSNFADYCTDIVAFVTMIFLSKKLHADERLCIFYIFILFFTCNLQSAYRYSDNTLKSKIAHLIGLGVFFEWFKLENTYTDINRFRHTQDLHLFFEAIPSGGIYSCLALGYLMNAIEPTFLEKLFRTLPACISLLTISYSCQNHFTSHLNNLGARAIFGIYMSLDVMIRTFTFSMMLVTLIKSNYSIFDKLSILQLILTTIFTKIIYFRKLKELHQVILGTLLANFSIFPILSHIFHQEDDNVSSSSYCSTYKLEYITQHIAAIIMIVGVTLNPHYFFIGIVFANIFIINLILQFLCRSINPIPWYVVLSLKEVEEMEKEMMNTTMLHKLSIGILPEILNAGRTSVLVTE